MEWEIFLDKFPGTYWFIGMRYLISAGIAFLIFYILFKGKIPYRKIQEKFPSFTDYRRDVFYSMVTTGIIAVVAIISFVYLKPYHVLYDSLSDKSIFYWLLTVFPIFFIHDFYFYCIHRLMHHPRLFKYIHKIHHQSSNPSPWTAYAFHPLEAIVEALIITILVFTVPTHALVIIAFMLFQIIYNVYGHLGFEIFPKNFHRTRIGKYINTSVAHNLHHHKFHGNYGLYTLIWDRVFGTLRDDYNESYEKATERPEIKYPAHEAG